MNVALNTIQANIDNLTSLWKQAGLPFNGYVKAEGFDYCEIENSEWPNRLWINQDITPELIATASAHIANRPSGFVLPYWDIYNSRSFEILDVMGYEKRSEQIGMSLNIDQPFTQQLDLNYQRVSDNETAQLWSSVFSRAFGYMINGKILARTCDDIAYYIAYYQDQPVGTAILYTTGNIAGIHAVGVIPEMRRKGLADDMMAFILNRAIAFNTEYATLQASAMGKGLYLKLGFKEEFVIRNYAFKMRS